MAADSSAVTVHDDNVSTRSSSCLRDAPGKFRTALINSLTSRYFAANLVYCIYACGILYINTVAYVAYTNAANDPANCLVPSDDGGGSTTTGGTTALYDMFGASSSSSSCDNPTAGRLLEKVNNLYIAFAVVHLVNAFMYIWAWFPAGFGLFSVVMIPEYLNVFGATLYLVTASYYWRTTEYESAETLLVHKLETTAATIELVAAFGWVATWWATYPRIRGRGYTIDDPDVGANAFIVIPSIIYLIYNIQIIRTPTEYGSNLLYQLGDILYGTGSFFYLIAAMRDDGWFWFMPTAGQLPYDADSVTPLTGSTTAAKGSGGAASEHTPLMSSSGGDDTKLTI